MASKRIVLCGLVVGMSTGLAVPALAADPPLDSARPPAPTCEGTPKTVEFKNGSARLSTDAKSVLSEVVVWAKATPDRSLQLRGSAPAGKSAKAKLDERRIAAVKSFLSQNGVEPDKMLAADAAPSTSASAGTSASATSPNVIEVATCTPATAMAPATSTASGLAAAGASASPLPEHPVPAVPSDSAALPPTTPPAPLANAGSDATTTTPGSMTTPTPATPSVGLDRTATGAPTMTTPPLQTNPQLPPPPPPFNPDNNLAPAPSYAADNGTPRNDSGGYRPHSRIGVETTIGGGVTGFLDDNARAFTETGGTWETRVAAGTRRYVALEAAYVGSAQNINALGVGSNARLVGNGVEGDLRINLTRQMVQPYLFGGVGWDHYRLSMDGANTSSLRDNDDIMTVPFGVGVAFRLSPGFTFDVRGTGRAAFYDDLMDGPYAASGQDARLHTWNVGGRLGWEF